MWRQGTSTIWNNWLSYIQENVWSGFANMKLSTIFGDPGSQDHIFLQLCWERLSPDLLKVNYLRSQIVFLKILHIRMGLKCHKKPLKILKNFVKLCQIIFKKFFFSCFTFKSTNFVQILKNVCRRASSRPQLLKAPSTHHTTKTNLLFLHVCHTSMNNIF